eukprot:SAG22_NODE_15811_length_340_cov_0.639004_1_plen_43_part_01
MLCRGGACVRVGSAVDGAEEKLERSGNLANVPEFEVAEFQSPE